MGHHIFTGGLGATLILFYLLEGCYTVLFPIPSNRLENQFPYCLMARTGLYVSPIFRHTHIRQIMVILAGNLI